MPYYLIINDGCNVITLLLMMTNYKIGTYFNTVVNVCSKIIFRLSQKWCILKQVFKKKLKDN